MLFSYLGGAVIGKGFFSSFFSDSSKKQRTTPRIIPTQPSFEAIVGTGFMPVRAPKPLFK